MELAKEILTRVLVTVVSIIIVVMLLDRFAIKEKKHDDDHHDCPCGCNGAGGCGGKKKDTEVQPVLTASPVSNWNTF